MTNQLLGKVKLIAEGALSFFSKLRVFYQIVIVITVLMVFLVAEGMLAYMNTNNMKERNKEIILTSINSMDGIFNYRLTMEKLKREYRDALIRRTNLTTNVMEGTSSLSNITDPELQDSIKTVIANVDQIRMMLNKATSEEVYSQIEGILITNDLLIKEIEMKSKAATEATVTLGKQFADRALITMIITVIFSLVVSVVLGIITAASISKPLKAIVDAVRGLSKGDLSRNVNAKGCLEAIQVVTSLNEAISSLRNLVSGVEENAEMLFTAGKELNLAANETGKSANEVSKAMMELAEASAEQTGEVNKTVATFDELSELVKKVSHDTEIVAVDSEKVVASAQTGQKVSSEVAEEINELYNVTISVAEVIAELNAKSQEINRITGIIEGIAEQTSLLALNAAIEAARAGENGKGFGVVAKETGKLADQSKKAAKLISEMLVAMLQRSEQAARSIEKGIKKVEAGKNLTMTAKTNFEEIFRTLEKIMAQINKVAGAAKQMAGKNEGAIHAISNISAISEETMASTEEVSATTQQQSASVEQVSALAENLVGISNKLKQSVSVFKIGGF